MKVLITAFVGLLSSCASTVFYRDGKPIAAFQGDMRGTEFVANPDGSYHWKAQSVSHSDATLAQGQAATSKIQAGSAIAATAASFLAK